MITLTLKPGREKSLLNRHPWVFSGAIDRMDSQPTSGETVLLRAHDGRFLGYAAFSPASQIRARVWSVNEQAVIDEAFLHRRLQQAIAARPAIRHDAGQRLVHGESDGLPGLVVDQYGPVLVLQALSAGIERFKPALVESLRQLTDCQCIYERSDVDVRTLEGLPPQAGVLWGQLPAGVLNIEEYGLRMQVDVVNGQKTGFYLDQRENRRRIGELARDRDMLNCFCFSGGFSLAALRGGARHVVSVDSSAEALQQAERNLQLNGLDPARADWVEADAFKYLRLLRDQGRSFDLIILDPPKFAPTAQHVEKAARAYKDINLLGLKLLRPGGLLATFTCSGGVSADLLQKIVASAAVDARCDASIVERFTAAPDHPVALSFPEGDYLKGLLVRKAGA
ncbi:MULTISPECIES: class I SAM-dependent rRNA methyltransferase [unclassified Paludibacterium]|uniref:class I SAM-dependent rRNA methyltransferase n=1 Tax=unclassified Paludibacterium TaxID=2618429 RepID=UPI001C04CB97|nr:class I SAM-dependent rRNA methyltransferase [Paludibacterium sp. B53371]BEV73795.1 class I SAM-dependent rRNA methyltransferase [Paludibacterium sp. THUN1379]